MDKTGIIHFRVTHKTNNPKRFEAVSESIIPTGIVSGFCNSIIITSSPLICFYFLQSSIALFRKLWRIKLEFIKDGEDGGGQIPKLVSAIA